MKTYPHHIKELEPYFEGADYMDIKIFEGKASLRKFIASMLSYHPSWLILLYRLRKLLVNILGLVQHEAPQDLPNIKSQAVSFAPGETVSFFIVRCAKENFFWISETPEDKHLKAYFGVVIEPQDDDINRFYVMTIVYYKHWTGPVYFNLIRPFHHIVVTQMARAGLG